MGVRSKLSAVKGGEGSSSSKRLDVSGHEDVSLANSTIATGIGHGKLSRPGRKEHLRAPQTTTCALGNIKSQRVTCHEADTTALGCTTASATALSASSIPRQHSRKSRAPAGSAAALVPPSTAATNQAATKVPTRKLRPKVAATKSVASSVFPGTTLCNNRGNTETKMSATQRSHGTGKNAFSSTSATAAGSKSSTCPIRNAEAHPEGQSNLEALFPATDAMASARRKSLVGLRQRLSLVSPNEQEKPFVLPSISHISSPPPSRSSGGVCSRSGRDFPSHSSLEKGGGKKDPPNAFGDGRTKSPSVFVANTSLDPPVRHTERTNARWSSHSVGRVTGSRGEHAGAMDIRPPSSRLPSPLPLVYTHGGCRSDSEKHHANNGEYERSLTVSTPVTRASSDSPSRLSKVGVRKEGRGSVVVSSDSSSNDSDDDMDEDSEEVTASSSEDDEDDDEEENNDDDDEEDDDEEDDDGDEEEEEEENDSSDAAVTPSSNHHRRKSHTSKTRNGPPLRLTTKVSREGDRNVKIIYIEPKMKFAKYAKEVMKRFGYENMHDFDMFCLDKAGDLVDVDVAEDYNQLTREYWRRVLAKRSSTAESDTSGNVEKYDAMNATHKPSTCFRRCSPPLPSVLSREHPTPPNSSAQQRYGPVPAEHSSDTVIRLYVRDSYAFRRRLGNAMASSQPTSFRPLDKVSLNSTALLKTTCSLDETFPRQLASSASRMMINTISFSENEEVLWSRMGVLGKGCFGTVYEGITHDGKMIAVKVQDIPDNEQSDAVVALQSEINLMRMLKHKNIVAYYGCQTRELPSGAQHMEIFLELCHGGSLSSLRRKFDKAGQAFSIALVRTYVKQILEGLCYLHNRNIIHRDIKSDNVLISAMGEAKLADFGCSKRIGTTTVQQAEGDPAAAKLYQTLVGTPLFMAPEVMQGDAGYSMAADIWSVGCLVLEMLGRQPWIAVGTSVFQLMFKISQSEGLPTGIPKNCPSSLLNFFHCCFQRDPSRRATAAELLKHEWIACAESKLEEVPPDDAN